MGDLKYTTPLVVFVVIAAFGLGLVKITEAGLDSARASGSLGSTGIVAVVTACDPGSTVKLRHW